MAEPLKDQLVCCRDHYCNEDRISCDLVFNPDDVRSAVGWFKDQINSKPNHLLNHSTIKELIDEAFADVTQEEGGE